jgi:hypothetical protein
MKISPVPSGEPAGIRQIGPGSFRSDRPIVGPGGPLTDAQWALIEPLLPDRTPERGGRWRDHREVIDAIVFTSRTGPQWMYLPDRYGLMAQADEEDDPDWAVSVDSTVVRAHQHPAGARKQGLRQASRLAMPSAAPAEDRQQR